MRNELIKRLEKKQKWRRGDGKFMPYTPKEFGLMIDDCIMILKGITDEQFKKIKKDNGSRT